MSEPLPAPPGANPLFVGIELLPSRGGPLKSLGFFQRALGGRIVSFTAPALMGEACEPVLHVPTMGGRLGASFLYVRKREIARLDALLPGVSLLSCHILFRHHAHWVWSRARREDVPFWIVPHGCLDPYVFTYRATIKRWWMRLYGVRMLRDAAHIIFSTRREMEKAAPWIPAGRGRVVHWSVELPDLEARAASRVAVRRKLGLSADARVLLFLGRLHAMKRPLETIAAFARASPAGWHLVVAGPDANLTAAQVAAVAKNAGVGERVHIVGPVYGAAKDELLLGADAFISLSIRENFNHAAAEAMAAGVPVILSQGNDLGPEIVSARGGWWLGDGPGADEAAITSVARAGVAELTARGDAARRFAAEKLSFETFAASLRALAEEASGAHGRGATGMKRDRSGIATLPP